MGERKGSAWWIRKVGWRASRKLTAELLLTDKWRAQKTGGKVDPSPHARNHCPSFSSPSLSLAAFPRIENRVSRVSYVTKRDFYSPVYYWFFNERKSSPPIFPLLPLWRTRVFQADFQILRHLGWKISFGIKGTRWSTLRVARFRVKRCIDQRTRKCRSRTLLKVASRP